MKTLVDSISLRQLATALFVVLQTAILNCVCGLPFQILFADEQPQPFNHRFGSIIIYLDTLKTTDLEKGWPVGHAGPSSLRVVLRILHSSREGLSAGEYLAAIAAKLNAEALALPGFPDILFEARQVGGILEASYKEDDERLIDQYTLSFGLTLGPKVPQARLVDTDKATSMPKGKAEVKGTSTAAPAASEVA